MNSVETLWPESMVRWRCRRGLKELDIYFLGYFDRQYAKMSKQERGVLQFLLLQQDPLLQSWLVYEQIPDDLPSPAKTLLRSMIADQRQHQDAPTQE